MKIKELKEKLNEFPEEMDDVEIFIESGDEYGMLSVTNDIDIFATTIVKILDRDKAFIKAWHTGKSDLCLYVEEATIDSLGMTRIRTNGILICNGAT